MSQYIEFYLKVEDKYINLAGFSRNSAVYQVANSVAHYETGILLDTICLNQLLNDLKDSINLSQRFISDQQQLKITIAQMNNSIEDKLDVFTQIDAAIVEAQDEIKDVEHAVGWFHALAEMADNGCDIWCGIEWNPNYKED